MNRLLLATLIFFLLNIIGLKLLLDRTWTEILLQAIFASIFWFFFMKFSERWWYKKRDKKDVS